MRTLSLLCRCCTNGMQRNAHITRSLKQLLIITWAAKMHCDVVADFGHEHLYTAKTKLTKM